MSLRRSIRCASLQAATLLVATGCTAIEVQLASRVVDAPGDLGTGYLDANNAVNGVVGAGDAAGGLDVFSVKPDSYIVLDFDGHAMVDEPGEPDLVVFENPFNTSDGRFMDPAVVEVSEDGEHWVIFPHAGPERYSDNPDDWVGFAGVEPVFFRSAEESSDPFGWNAGGDRFFLEDVALTQPRFVRIRPASQIENPASGQLFEMHPISDGPDIDGVAARIGRR